VGLRENHFKGTAKTDVTGTEEPITLEQKLFSLRYQRAWNPLSFKPLYWGIGAELARGTTQKVMMGGAEIPTSAENLPLYLGVNMMAGLQVPLGRRFSLAAEAYASAFLNQSTPVFETGLSGLLLVWF
jgi:hypothetical protein